MKTKKFRRYFFSTFKEGKFLLFKFVAAALLYTVITVLSNLLQVEELTYLNAFLALSYFSTMIAFGVSNGTNVLVNQSINSRFRVRRYASIGFKINFGFTAFFTVLLVAFPKFMMQTLTGYTPSDWTFYYIMCVFFFCSGIKEFLLNTLKNLQIFKLQFFCEAFNYILIIFGFLVLYFGGVYFLNYIAIVYVVATVVSIMLCVLALSKNRIFKMNILAKSDLNLSKKQWLLFLSNIVNEVIWEIGYFATSVFMLRMSETFLNTYSYLENVLDVFNGVLFAFISITCVRIIRALGRNAFDRAYTHAKYSILATIVIWVFYMIASMVFIYPIALGANKEYFNVMFIITPCYVLVALVRFLNWNFGSYMLRLGGKNKWPMALTTAYSLMFVVLCFVAHLIPDNVFLGYFLLALPELVIFPFYVVIFLKKKWMANINSDPTLLRNKIKCFIFDFDDTLYYGEDWSEYIKTKHQYFDEHFAHLSERERKLLRKKYGARMRTKNFDIVRILVEEEGSCEGWIKYRDSLPVTDEQKDGKAIQNREIAKFYKQGRCYIVSNSGIDRLKQKAKAYGIDLEYFKKIYANKFDISDVTKQSLYKKIMGENKLSPDEVMVIGNSKTADILPAKNLGMHTFRAKNGFTYEEVIS